MPGIPANYRDLLEKKAFAHLATLSAGGAPQSTPVWVDFENPYRYIQIGGRVAEMTEQGADAHIDALAQKYLGQSTYPYRRPGEVRVIVTITPERVQTMG